MIIGFTIWLAILFEEVFFSQFYAAMNTGEMFQMPCLVQCCYNLSIDGFVADATGSFGKDFDRFTGFGNFQG